MDTAVANDSGYEISWISDNYLKFIIKKSPVKKTTTTTSSSSSSSSSSPSSSTTTTPIKSPSPPKNKRERLQLDNVEDEDDSNYKLPSLEEFKKSNNNENSNKNTTMDSNNNNNSVGENVDTLLKVPELALKDFNNKKQKKHQKHQKHKKQQKHPKDVVFKDLDDSNTSSLNDTNIEKQPMDIQSISNFVLNPPPPPLDSPTTTTTTTTSTNSNTNSNNNQNKDEEKDVKLEENEKENKEEIQQPQKKEEEKQQKEGEENLDLNYNGNTVLGTRDENQDSFFHKNFKSEKIRVIGVFDGHGDEGMVASVTTRDIISNCIEKEIVNSNDNKESNDFYDKCITNSFLEANEALLEKGKITGDWGTTATLAIIKDNHIRVGWVGDSMAVLFKQSTSGRDYTPIQLSNDHKPENPQEKKRIITTGGRVVFRCGCYRVIPNKNDYSNDDIMKQRLALNMSRALGHVVLSKYGVSSTPEFHSESLNPGDYVILASDGLWNVLDFKAIQKYIKKSTSVKELTDLLLSVVESKCQSFKIPCDNVTICCYKHT
ncbi:hypothetical protein ACTFIV_008335 [Dictyostelium citrinum]